jgi:hypothetical protein
VSRHTPAARSRRAIQIILAVVLFAGLAGAASPAFAVRTIGLSSPSFDFNVAAGGGGKGSLVISNEGNEPFRALVYFSGQTIDSKGNVSFVAPTLNSPDFLSTPAAWCQVHLPKDTKSIGNVPYLDLKPKEQVPVDFEFTVPQGVTPGDHQVFLFFEMTNTQAVPKGVATTINARVGAHLHIRVQGAVNESLDVRPFTVRQFIIGDVMPWQFTVRNDGNIDEQVSTTLSVLDTNENELIKSNAMTSTVVYAQSLAERSGNLPLANAFLGRFTVRLTTTYADRTGSAGAKTVVKDRTIWVVPLWLAVVLIVVVGALLLWLSWRAAVRSAERRIDRRRDSEEPDPARRSRQSRARGTRGATARPSEADDYGDEYEDVSSPGPSGPDSGPRD